MCSYHACYSYFGISSAIHTQPSSGIKTYQLAVLWTEQSCFQSQIQNCFQLARCTCRTHTLPTSPGCNWFYLLQSWPWYLELQMFLELQWSGTGRLGSESWGSHCAGAATVELRWHHQIPQLGNLLALMEGLCMYRGNHCKIVVKVHCEPQIWHLC